MKQAEKTYLISDAAKQVQVESHVLRYWEEELKLPIKRNEMGHRYYTEEDIARFKEVRDLKEQGLQLKAIRNMFQRGKLASEESMKRHVVMVNNGEFMPITEESKESKSLRLQQLLQNMITEAVRSNNREVCEEIKESMLKELDYQFRIQEEREDERDAARISRQEEHYRQIDELIRSRNKIRRSRSVENNISKENSDEHTGQPEKDSLQDNNAESSEGKVKKGFFQRKKRSIK
ncbi:MAG: helix-turn-helix domain-containing protein [Suilimivivens sp.]